MTAIATEAKDASPITTPEGATTLLRTIFDPSDRVLFRPIEIWTERGKKRARILYKQTWHPTAKTMLLPSTFTRITAEAAAEHGNCFFGVCPRFGGNGKYDLAWQIRTVRALWSDIDHCTVEEAKKRIEAAGLPAATVIVNSGNGVHLYWLLTEPCRVDDVGDPLPVLKEWITVNDKKRPRKYILGPDGQQKIYEYLTDPKTGGDSKKENPKWPTISTTGKHIQDVLAGIASKIGGDHTQDLTRLLRLPNTMNRKDERNGKSPVPCELVECDPHRKYPFVDFEKFAEAAPEKVKAEAVAKVRLRTGVKLTPHRRNRLNDFVNACAVAEVGSRSGVDFHLCAWAVEHGIDKEEVWGQVETVGKFADRGREYFDRTWGKAEAKTREKVYNRACRSANRQLAGNNGNGSGNGHTNGFAGPPPVEPAFGGAARSTGSSGGSGLRPEIEITADEHIVNSQVLRALQSDPTIFQRGGAGLVHVVRDAVPKTAHGITRPPSTPRIAAIPAGLLREKIAAAAEFVAVVETPDGPVSKRKHPPDFTIAATLARGQWEGIRPLEGVVVSPVLRPDGTILGQPGYDAETGLLYEPDGEYPEVPANPTAEQVEHARDTLLDVVMDFPFKEEIHKATWVAGVLTPLARHAFPGPAPLFLNDSNVRGSGKGLLCDVTAQIVSGRPMPVMSNPEDEDEARKRITALALAGDPLILLDNIAGSLGGPSIDAALTSVVWRDRILGRSEIVELPLRATWYATGNNVVLLADTARRVAHIRLESSEENPEEREGFTFPDLREYVRQHRPRLLVAALTILRGYCAAGKPNQKLKPWGSFEGWSALVRSAVVWCSLPDPGETRKVLREQSDQEANALPAIIAGIEFLDKLKAGLTVSQLLELSEQHKSDPHVQALREAIIMVCPARGGDFPSPKSIGRQLQHLKGRVAGGKRINKREENHTGKWFVESADGK